MSIIQRVRDLFMASKLDKLQSKKKALEKKRHRAKKNQEYHARQKLIDKNSASKFEKHEREERRYTYILEDLDADITIITGEIAAEEKKIKEKAYNKELGYFKLELVELLKALKASIESGHYKEAFYQAQDINEFLAGKLPKFQHSLTKFTGYFKSQSVVTMLSNIIEKESTIIRVSATRGSKVSSGVRGGKFSIWVKNLIGILDSAIKMLEK